MTGQWARIVDPQFLGLYLCLRADSPESQEQNDVSVSRLNETEDDPTNVMPLLVAGTNPAVWFQHVFGILKVDGGVLFTLYGPIAQLCEIVSQRAEALDREMQAGLD